MTFKVFRKTGELYDSHGDWDGDDGYYEEIEVSDEKVDEAIVEIVFTTYFAAHIPYLEHTNGIIVARIKKQIERFISDCDLEETMRECFSDELKEWAQEEYEND